MIEFFLIISSIIIAFFFGMNVGWKFREKVAMRNLKELNDVVNGGETFTKENSIMVKVEEANNTFYIFNHDTDSFITQGNTKSEIEDTLKKMYPDKNILMKQSSLEIYNKLP